AGCGRWRPICAREAADAVARRSTIEQGVRRSMQSSCCCGSRSTPRKLARDMTFIDPRLTESRNAPSAETDLATPLEIVDLINAEDQSVPDAVASQREA